MTPFQFSDIPERNDMGMREYTAMAAQFDRAAKLLAFSGFATALVGVVAMVLICMKVVR